MLISDQWPAGGSDKTIETLQQRYVSSLSTVDIPGLLHDPLIGRPSLVSSFGADSAVLLHYVSSHLPDIPIIFIDTGKHFNEVIEYKNLLADHLSLNIIDIEPNPRIVEDEDPKGDLFRRDADACCLIRKTFPLQDALQGFDSWISGRKRFQSASRQTLPIIERDGEKIKINPLALWSAEDIRTYFIEHELPHNPLVARGYPSIGCAACTRKVLAGEDSRAGRWADAPEKTECGIHLGPDGRFVRSGGNSGSR